jgi:hypothetical protein
MEGCNDCDRFHPEFCKVFKRGMADGKNLQYLKDLERPSTVKKYRQHFIERRRV